MALSDLRADAAAHRERIAKSKLDSAVKMELAENILPLFEGLIEAIEEEVQQQIDDLGAAVDELIDQSEDVLHPETTAQIVGVLEVGKMLAHELELALSKLEDEGVGDEAEFKRVTDLVMAYRQATPLVEAMLAKITLDASDDGEDAGDGGNEDDGDDPNDGDEDDDEDLDTGVNDRG